MDNMDIMRKVKVQLDEDVVNSLIQLKKIGDTYSDVVRGLLKK
jgi:predicted CopG family antitoxin